MNFLRLASTWQRTPSQCTELIQTERRCCVGVVRPGVEALGTQVLVKELEHIPFPKQGV